jgi:hypothetical protein
MKMPMETRNFRVSAITEALSVVGLALAVITVISPYWGRFSNEGHANSGGNPLPIQSLVPSVKGPSDDECGAVRLVFVGHRPHKQTHNTQINAIPPKGESRKWGQMRRWPCSTVSASPATSRHIDHQPHRSFSNRINALLSAYLKPSTCAFSSGQKPPSRWHSVSSPPPSKRKKAQN